MEHYTVKQRRDGYYVLTPDKGYVLVNKGQEYTKAVIKKYVADEWKAVRE